MTTLKKDKDYTSFSVLKFILSIVAFSIEQSIGITIHATVTPARPPHSKGVTGK